MRPGGRPFRLCNIEACTPVIGSLFYAFDLPQLGGRDLTGYPLVKRRARLAKIIESDADLRILGELPGTAADVLQAVRDMRLEGVVSKRRNSLYRPGERSDDWVKLKLERQQEFVVGGYRLGAPNSVDALLVGYYDGKDLRFAAKVRGGLIPHLRRALLVKLRPLRTPRCPFSNLPAADTSRWGGGVTADQMSEMQWTKPQLVVQVQFVEWTAENRLRHAKFLGVREDKAPREVAREP